MEEADGRIDRLATIMSCCYEPGQVLILPVEGGKRALDWIFRDRTDRPEILWSVEDAIDHYQIEGSKSRYLFPSFPLLVRVPVGTEIESALKFQEVHGVKASHPNFFVRPASLALNFNDAFLDSVLVDSGLATTTQSCGQGVTIAVLDTGVDPALLQGSPISSQFDTDSPRTGSTTSLLDAVGHGTLVAEIIRRGAPGATIQPIKVMNDVGSVMSVIAGVYLGAALTWPDVFNLSLRLSLPSGVCPTCAQPSGGPAITKPQLKLQFDNIDLAYANHGLQAPLLIAAAGNLLPRSHIALPADLDNFIAVGAIAHPGTTAIASYSQYSSVPSNRFIRAVGGEDPSGTFATRPRGTQWSEQRFFGTSFATAVVTAAVARYLCARKGGHCAGLPATSLPAATSSTIPTTTRTREYITKCLSGGAMTNFAGYDPAQFGMGILGYSRSVANASLVP